MTDAPRPDGPALHLVPGHAHAQPDQLEQPDPDVATPEADADRDPLLARAERIADLPLGERPAAFDGLNRAVVAELNQLEEG